MQGFKTGFHPPTGFIQPVTSKTVINWSNLQVLSAKLYLLILNNDDSNLQTNLVHSAQSCRWSPLWIWHDPHIDTASQWPLFTTMYTTQNSIVQVLLAYYMKFTHLKTFKPDRVTNVIQTPVNLEGNILDQVDDGEWSETDRLSLSLAILCVDPGYHQRVRKGEGQKKRGRHSRTRGA